MGLFGGSSSKTVTYGKEETKALQPDLFKAYEAVMQGGGTPDTWLHRAPLNQAINTAYQTAQRELGAMGYGGNVMSDLAGDTARGRAVDVGNIWGQMGLGALRTKLGTAGDMAQYIAALTSARKGYTPPMQPWYQNLIAPALKAGGGAMTGLAGKMGPTQGQTDIANMVTGGQVGAMNLGLPPWMGGAFLGG